MYFTESVYIAGRVKVVKKNNKLKIKSFLKTRETGVEFANFKVSKYLLMVAKISSKITVSNVPSQPLALMVTLDKNEQTVVTAVPTLTVSDFVCQQRKSFIFKKKL